MAYNVKQAGLTVQRHGHRRNKNYRTTYDKGESMKPMMERHPDLWHN
jgi:hypothetical protein